MAEIKQFMPAVGWQAEYYQGDSGLSYRALAGFAIVNDVVMSTAGSYVAGVRVVGLVVGSDGRIELVDESDGVLKSYVPPAVDEPV